MTTRRWYCD